MFAQNARQLAQCSQEWATEVTDWLVASQDEPPEWLQLAASILAYFALSQFSIVTTHGQTCH